jgi:hypothetical protein
MKVVLVFPPLSWPFAPHLGLPSLAAYLRRHGHDVVQVDANLELHNRLLDPAPLRALHARLQEGFCDLDRREALSVRQQEGYRALLSGGLLRLPAFFDRAGAIRAAFHDIDRYRLREDGTVPLEDAWAGYLSLKDIVLPEHPNPFDLPVVSLARLRSCLDGSDPLPYQDLLSGLAAEVAGQEPGLVGFSFAFSEQAIPGLALMRLVREAAPGAYLVAGGTYFTALRDGLPQLLPQLPFVDGVVLDEGEGPLLALAEALERGGSPAAVPGVASCAGGRYVYNAPPPPLPMDDLPCPDFGGLKLDEYFTARPVLPYATARGCYYGRCAFCNFTLQSRHFRGRSPALVARDLDQLQRLYGALFYLVQEAEPPRRMAAIADALVKQRANVNYQLFARFERGFDQDLAAKLVRSGCLYVFFGLESGNDRVNRLMRKGVEVAEARRIVGCCAAAGLNVVVSSIRSFPTETAAEWEDTRAFYRDIRERYGSAIRITGGSHFYRLGRGSLVDRAPGEFGVAEIYRQAAGELNAVLPAYRWAGDDGSGFLALQERYLAESPLILYNELLVLVITALAGRDIVRFSTVRGRARAPDAAVAAVAAPPDGCLLFLAPGVRVLECRFPVGEIWRLSQKRRLMVREMFLGRGLDLERIWDELERAGPTLAPEPTLVLCGRGGESMVVSPRLRPLIGRLEGGATLDELCAGLHPRAGPDVRRQLGAFLRDLRRCKLVVAQRGAAAGRGGGA